MWGSRLYGFTKSVVNDQLVALNTFWRPELRIPVILIWIASFGSSLHDPVTIFYYLKVGGIHTHTVMP